MRQSPFARTPSTFPALLLTQAVNDTFIGTFNAPFSPPAGALILANDSSPNLNPSLRVVAAGPPDAGNLTSWDASGNFSWMPPAGFTGAHRGLG